MSDREPESQYIHGTDPAEQARLSKLNDLLNAGALAELRLSGGERVLDVGSGLGQLTRAMARAAGPAGHVVGVERSAEQLAEALRQAAAAGEEGLVEFRAGDASALPLRDDEWGAFDVAHSRFLLEHVREPRAVVRAMLRAVRPGGRILLQDDDHEGMRLWPEPPGFRPLWEAYVRGYDRLGNDPYVGRRLVALLHEAGADPVRNSYVFFGACSGDPRFGLFVENLAHILEESRGLLAREGLLEAGAIADGVAALRAWGRRPDAAIWYAVSWAEGRRSG